VAKNNDQMKKWNCDYNNKEHDTVQTVYCKQKSIKKTMNKVYVVHKHCE